MSPGGTYWSPSLFIHFREFWPEPNGLKLTWNWKDRHLSLTPSAACACKDIGAFPESKLSSHTFIFLKIQLQIPRKKNHEIPSKRDQRQKTMPSPPKVEARQAQCSQCLRSHSRRSLTVFASLIIRVSSDPVPPISFSCWEKGSEKSRWKAKGASESLPSHNRCVQWLWSMTDRFQEPICSKYGKRERERSEGITRDEVLGDFRLGNQWNCNIFVLMFPLLCLKQCQPQVLSWEWSDHIYTL